jgi:predicted CXXCH cytochrome family protein
MPADPGRSRPARIALDYFKQSDSLRRWKWILTVAATVVALAWILSGILFSDGGRLRYSRGPVASVHAMWDAQCESCHSSFQPIQGDAWAASIFGTAGDAKCQRCHTGPEHHEGVTAPPCASCHQEHQGREASLVRLADAVCVQCHGDLTAHKSGSKYASSITRFNLDHPEIRIEDPETGSRNPLDDGATDPGKLKFNHRLHRAPGLTLDKDGKEFKYKDIRNPIERERYIRETEGSADKAVQLKCESCHQLDSELNGKRTDSIANLPGAAVSPPRAAGASMLPIVYEKHCKACHPITFDKDSAAVPHRLQPKELKEYLKRHYAGRLLEDKESLFDKEVPPRLIPGKSRDPEMEKAMNRILSKVSGAEKVLYKSNDKKTCSECHYYDENHDIIKSTNVPTIWLPHAYFNHLSHRAVECAGCHKDADTSTDAKVILLPRIDVCKKCHAPPAKNSGGARTNCTECHRYHNGDAPLQGTGAQKRKPNDPNTIDDLRGRP